MTEEQADDVLARACADHRAGMAAVNAAVKSLLDYLRTPEARENPEGFVAVRDATVMLGDGVIKVCKARDDLIRAVIEQVKILEGM